MEPLLKLERVSSFIESFHILQEISVEVYAGEAVVILGRNGAGKTTTLRSIMGMLPAVSGLIELAGCSLLDMPAYKIASLGIGYVPEDYGVFDLLTVEENLRLAMRKRDKATLERQAYVLDVFPDLKKALPRLASTLSGGQRQMLSIARALLNENKIILIDEPSKGLAPIIVEKVRDALLEIKKNSTLVLVEQNFALACAVGDRYYILNEGFSVRSGKVVDISNDVELQKKYLGIVSAC